MTTANDPGKASGLQLNGNYQTSNIEDEAFVFPASFGQQRLWFLDQFDPGSPYYNIPSALRIKGPFSISVLKDVIDEIARRHESLRTNFSTIDGKPVQVISQSVNIPFSVIDLKSLSDEKKEREIMRLANEASRYPFNISNEPLLRITVLQAGIDDNVVIAVMHHIISDGWSMSILVGEITKLYAAYSNGMPSPLPELAIQYADFTLWQKEYLEGEIMESQLNYWMKQLGDNPPFLELPADRPRPAIWTNNGASISRTIPKKTMDEIQSFSRKENVTFFMTLLAAFKVLLLKYTHQEDIPVGTPIANRTRRELENIIGLFINTIVIRTDLSGNPAFREILQRVKKVTLEGYENQDLPFELLVEKLQPDREMSYQPLFQVMFILQNLPVNSQALPDLGISLIDVHMGTSTFDITLTLAETPEGLDVSAEFNTDLFDQKTIEQFLSHYECLLNNILADPEQSISSLRLIDNGEINKIIYEWNKTKAVDKRANVIHRLFEAQAESSPDNTAAVFQGSSISYRQLNERANQLAHILIRLGVGPETVVGICIERSLEMMISLLAVLKAGGAYLPLDASYPEDRLAYMLENSDAKVLITQSNLLNVLPQFNGPVLLMDKIGEELDKESTENIETEADENNLVYIIYTSGSTGKPKGTMIAHSSLVNQYLAWETEYELKTRARNHLQMASFSFDVFAGDWTRALCSGGKLVIAPRELLLEGEALYNLMKNEQVNIAEFVPAVLRNLIQYLETSGNNLNFFDLLIAGSDIWYVGEYKKFLKFCGMQTRLINSFGLTEATIDSCYFEGRGLNISDERLVPIGYPFSNTAMYILDEHMQPLPSGLKGELYVGGAGLSRGYLKRPDITAEKFIPNPFSTTPGERMYKTGDLARYLSDGNVEFLGRKDNQVKLRGFRVELGEIETALSEYEGVKDAAVIAREDNPGDKRIVAYIVSTEDSSPKASDLKEYLSGRMPEYMVPSAFVFLEKLPLTPNGKVDRRSLPAPDMDEILQEIKMNFVAPRTPAEEVIASIWAEILDIEKVGIHDNFFDLGGHSLLATQVISRMRNAFNIDIPLRCIFETPTILELAQKVELEQISKAGLKDAVITPVPSGERIPLSFSQERLWFLDQLEPESSFYNMPEIFRIKGSLNTLLLEKSLNEIVKRHEVLRTSYPTVDGKAVTVVTAELEIKIPLIDLSGCSPLEQDKLITSISDTEVRTYIPLDSLPLFRVKFLKLSEEEHVFIAVFHHIITDEWSSKVMLGEIAAIYDSLVKGREIQLPELKLQYSDYAYWQRKFLSGENLERQLSYWKSKLEGCPPLLELPIKGPRPKVQTFRGDYLNFELGGTIIFQLEKFNKRHGVTMFMSLLSVFQVLLNRLSNQDDIVVGTPIANRNRADIEKLIGFFVNTLVLRCRLEKGMKFSELLNQTRQTAVESYTYQDLPFEMLVDAVQPVRDLSHSPLFQVMFVIQNAQPKAQQVNSALSLLPVEVHAGTSKFDLTFFVVEEPDRLGFALEYNSDLFDPSDIEAFFGYYKMILLGVLKNPDIEISRIPLLTEKEEKDILKKLNSPVEIPLLNEFAHRMFEHQAELSPERAAIYFDGNEISYSELNKKANQLARYLLRLGVTSETKVGVAVPRSADLIVSLLGILKAGACYVPLDISYPKERLSYIAEDSELSLLITTKTSDPGITLDGSKIILMDQAWDEISKESIGNIPFDPDMNNLVYIIYTSGSTGRPKGTMITHSNLMNYLSWCLAAYPYSEAQETIFHSTIAFDATVTSVYPALISGHAVRIIPEEKDIYLLGEELKRNTSVNVVKITPAHLDILSQQLSDESSVSLKAFVVGGENLRKKQISFYQQNLPDILIYNEYGPTEATVGCVVFEGSKYEGPGSVPIGKVIPGAQVYILDDNLNPVPENVPGELYIGGKGLSRGYLNRADLTAEKFIPDPFGPEMSASQMTGSRLYKTGDLVKLLKDGNIEFLGRTDEQVKIRGYRVELGEIETVLKSHPDIKDVQIVKSKIQQEDKLIAYCIAENYHQPTTGELRDYMEDKIPGYMIPSVFMFLVSFPLTPNGKIDFRRLPDPKVERAVLSEGFIPAESQAELILLQIWQEVLGVDKIGILDNFFELGGDSIVSIQVVARANQAGFKLTPRDVFQNPTIKSLALAAANTRTIIAQQGTVSGQVSLSPVQHWFFEQQLNEPDHYNQSMLLEIKEPLELKRVEAALTVLIGHHDVLRSSFIKNETSFQMNILPSELCQVQYLGVKPDAENLTKPFVDVEGGIPLIHMDLSEVPDAVLSHSVECLTSLYQASLNIENTLMKVIYFDSGQNRKHWMLIIIHHLVIDVVSWRILLEDFQSAYRQLRLPLKSTSFMDWSKRLLEFAQSKEMTDEFEYWHRLGSEKIPEIITDSPFYSNLEDESVSIQVVLDEENTNVLLREVPKVLHTEISHSLLSALTRAFARHTGEEKIYLALEGHGREELFSDMELSRTIGWFTSIYPVLLDLKGVQEIGESVSRIKDEMSKIPHRGIGFGILKYLSRDERIRLSMNMIPDPKIAFNYLGQFGQAAATGEASPVIPAHESKGPERSPKNERSYMIEITSGIMEGRLSSEWTFSQKIFTKEKIQNLANDYLNEILSIVNFVKNKNTDFSAGDFSDFGWDQKDIDKILSAINGAKE